MPDPLTPDQALDVLLVAAAYDNREPSAMQAGLWAADLNDAGITGIEAAAAIRRFYRDRPDAYIKPGHVIALVGEARRVQREADQNRLALASVDTNRPGVVGEEGMPRIRAMLDAARARAAARANLAANPTSPEGPRD